MINEAIPRTDSTETPAAAPAAPMTHEAYIEAIRGVVVARVNADERKLLVGAKLVYGAGQSMVRGVTYHEAWQNGGAGREAMIEVSAAGEENPVQIAGTTLHELAHVLAGVGHGHDAQWKAAAARLGLLRATAAGQAYRPEDFDVEVWRVLTALPVPGDGRPVFNSRARLPLGGIPLPLALRPCPIGIGTRGGKSRGAGSGSRMRLYGCACDPVVKVRAATDDLDATCNRCGSKFVRREAGRRRQGRR